MNCSSFQPGKDLGSFSYTIREIQGLAVETEVLQEGISLTNIEISLKI